MSAPIRSLYVLFCLLLVGSASGQDVELQPLGAQVQRLIQSLDFVGQPLSQDTLKQLESALAGVDAFRPKSRDEIWLCSGKTEQPPRSWSKYGT